jgi:uncharacterized beta-barrel protein YwiB (DUF1934 family)
MDNVLIEITGIQRIDSVKDKMEMTTHGTVDETDEHYIIRYTEEQEPPLSPVNVQVKIDKDEKCVEMTRTGAFDSCLIIEKARRNLCRYATEYGDILLGIAGHYIAAENGEDGGSFNFSYDIDVNGALASRNEVIINYRYN